MYPEASAVLSDEYCQHCHLRHQACWCPRWQDLPDVNPDVRFYLLAHPRELKRPTNSGHILLRAMPDTEYGVWSRTQMPPNLAALLSDPGSYPVLVYPDTAEAAPGLSPQMPVNQMAANQKEGGRRVVYILLDGTWQEAGKLWRQSPYLRSIPRVALANPGVSAYGLRRNQRDNGLSTIEVAVQLLAELEYSQSSEALARYFKAFLRHYQASQSNHKPKPEGADDR